MSEQQTQEKLSRDEEINEIHISNEILYIEVVYGITVMESGVNLDDAYAEEARRRVSIHAGMPSSEKKIRELNDLVVRLNCLATLFKSRQAYSHKIQPVWHHPYVKIHPGKFRFPNDHRRTPECVKAAFKYNGMEVAEIQRDGVCWTWVLTTTGDLWLHDTSHGGGGEFSLYSRSK